RARRRFSQSADRRGADPGRAADCFWGRSGRSLERWDLELDLGELIGGLADLAKEWQPARVGVDFVEQVLRHDFGESPVLVSERLIEPFERFVGIAAERVDVSDVVGCLLLVFRDQRIEGGIGVGFAPERAVGYRQADHPVALGLLLLDLGKRAGGIALSTSAFPSWACAPPRLGLRLSSVRDDAVAAPCWPAAHWK